MAAIPMTDFDLGPLSWVKTEIDHSLDQAREHLDKLAAAPADRAPVRYILTHLHQATGALAMVGLAAATRFSEELEKLVAFLETEEEARLVLAIAAAKRGIAALANYLDALLAGQPDHPMSLLGTYLAINRARGQSDASEGDLFFPDLAAPLPPPPPATPLDEAVLAKALAHQRSQYQMGLLKVLKGGDASEALRQMQAAILAIESIQAATPNRPFWTAAAGFFDALVYGGLELSPTARQLFARVDQQIKALIEGATKVAERAFRDLLLAVGRARAVTDRVGMLKTAYRLDTLVAVPETLRGADDEGLAALLRELREATAQLKDAWLKFTSGNRAAIEPFGKVAVQLATRGARIGRAELAAVFARLADIAPALKAREIPPSEAQALEVATALLFLESTLENYFRLGGDFDRQAKTVAERLASVMSGDAPPPVDTIAGGLLDEMTRRAQERLLVFQVGQEVLVNLQNIEQVLDGFFRDAAKRPELAALAAQFTQVQGALMIMELGEAAALNAAVLARVQQFAEGSLDGTGEAAEMVADGLSALGLYISALQQGSASPRAVLLPALLRFGLAEAPGPAETPARRTATVSPVDLDVQKQKVAALYEDWKEQPAAETRDKLAKAVDALQRDAALVADADVARQSEAALEVIKDAESPDQTGVFRAIQGLAPAKAPEPPAPQVVQLVDAPGAEVDRELLEIFLEEANGVVGEIGESLAAARSAPTDREALTTIRRGFHTLKGSGRMVGLTELGEMAWQCEQVMNKWLHEEQPASPALLGFIELARGAFQGWVRDLQASGGARIDGAEITRQAERLKSGEPLEPPAAQEPAGPAAEPAAVLELQPAAEEIPDAAAPADEQAAPVVEEGAPVVEEAPQAAAADAAQAAEETTPVVEEPAPAMEPLAFEFTLPPTAEPGEAPPSEPAVPAMDFSFLDAPSEPVAPPAPALEPAAELTEALAGLPAPAAVDEPAELPPAEGVAEATELAGAPPVEPAPAEPAPAADLSAPEPEEAPAAMPPVAFAPLDLAPPAEEDVAVGDVRVPAPLFAIYVGEAEEHAASLDRELARIEADPLVPVSDAFMRAAHTLASSSRTTGFEPLAQVAAALEKWLTDAIELPPEFDARRLVLTRRAVDAVGAMVRAIGERTPPAAREDVVADMESLRAGLREARRTGEGTHLRLPGIARDETAPPPPSFAEPVVAPAVVPPVVAPPVAELPVAELPGAPDTPQAEPPAPEAQPQTFTPAPPMEPVAETAPATEAAPAFEGGKDQRKIKDDVDRDLLPVFLDEAREIIPLVSEGVRRWKAMPSDHSAASELQRHLHTLKGSARMTGLMRLGELAHLLEASVNALDEIESPPAVMFEEVEERVDRFSGALERLASGEEIRDIEPIEVPVAAVFEHQKDKPAALAVIAAAAEERAERDALPPELREGRAALLRVNADTIDRFVNEAGELSIARSRIELEMANFRRALVDLTENIGRMRAQLREIEIAAESQMQSTIKAREEAGETFDPLEFDRFTRMQELTRFLAESLGDVITLHQGLQKNLDETELAIHAQARLNRELQQGLMSVRLVPLGNLADRFYRVVRQTAKELDKKANLELKGTRTELDRSVLEKITAPFEHLLRNAIAHGLEAPGDRAAAGKPEIGEITLEATQRGNEVVLTVTDDGRGLDFARIREKAVATGLLAPDVELPESQLAQFIFSSGFSTAERVDQIAGRGVGLDVVKSEITTLGGRVEIASSPGRGTTFTITLPLTLAVTQAVMLRAGSTTYAVPSVMVEQVQEYKAAPYEELASRGVIEWKGNAYPLRSLLPLLGEPDSVLPARQIPVLLLRSGVQRAAVRVDEIVGNREVVVKTIGPQLSRLAGIAGATVLGNGQVVLILNPVQLVHRERQPEVVVRAAPAAAPAAEEKPAGRLVMVVDDSLTVRKITSRMLAREGFEVATAKDGVDALQQLQDIRPDCILLDVEMPRMDGFEFARNVRADAATKAIPIVMITSRTADKHRNHAIELGVNEYMGKPYQEDQLLALVRRYTAREPAAA